jgi:plasmid stability protein
MKSLEVFYMASITIRNLDESLKIKLRLQSAQHGCSMEAEVRNILRQVLFPAVGSSDFATRIQQRFTGLIADSLPIPERQTARTPPDMGL